MRNIGIVLTFIAFLSGCAAVKGVRQQDLEAWVGMPVEALDTHSLFITVPMIKTQTESGVEIRNYANTQSVSGCSGTGGAYAYGKYVSANVFSNCTTQTVGCNNIFYIKEGKVVEYAPTGQCYTDETVQPQARYKNFIQKKPAQ